MTYLKSGALIIEKKQSYRSRKRVADSKPPADKKDGLLLACDSGGSKTHFCLLDSHSNIIAERFDKGVASLHSGIISVDKILSSGIKKMCFAASIKSTDISHVYFSLGGPNVDEINSALSNILPGADLSVEREASGSLFSVCARFLDCQAIVMAGTGTVAIGEYDGIRRFAGGWGPVFDDDGSGFMIGREAVSKALLMLDRRIETTSLIKIIEAWSPENIEKDFNSRMKLKADICGLSREQLASLAPRVYDSYLNGDPAAEQIIRKAVSAIAELAAAVIPAEKRNCIFKILAVGGIFKQGEKFRTLCSDYLKEIRPDAEFMFRDDFDLGRCACLMVLKKAGKKITKDVFNKLALN